jgi:predicted N-acetyltransferase YhbS
VRRAALFAIAALTVTVAAVATASAATPFKRHAVKGQGVSIAVPAAWIAIESGIPQSVIEELSKQNQALAPYIDQLATPGSPMKLLALDPTLHAGFATNANVVVVPVPAGTTFDLYRLGVVAGLRALKPGRIAQRVVTIGGKKALRVSYRFRITLGRPRTVQTLQYAFLRGARSIVVTYTTLPSLASRYAGTFARSAASIRIA